MYGSKELQGFLSSFLKISCFWRKTIYGIFVPNRDFFFLLLVLNFKKLFCILNYSIHYYEYTEISSWAEFYRDTSIVSSRRMASLMLIFHI